MMLLLAAPSLTCADEVSLCTTVREASEGEVECGLHRSPDDHPCAEPGQEEVCANLQAGNEMVAACVMEAVADGVAFSYGNRIGDLDGQYGSTSTYHVTAEGDLWREQRQSEDLCSVLSTMVYEPVSFEGCTDWDCVRERVGGSDLRKECSEVERCEGS